MCSEIKNFFFIIQVLTKHLKTWPCFLGVMFTKETFFFQIFIISSPFFTHYCLYIFLTKTADLRCKAIKSIPFNVSNPKALLQISTYTFMKKHFNIQKVVVVAGILLALVLFTIPCNSNHYHSDTFLLGTVVSVAMTGV